MTSFTVRVELHGASWQDYVNLAARLRAQSVVDVIQGSNGVWYRLPPAEYNYIGSETAEQVRAAVVAVASEIKANPAVLVTQAVNQVWQGLESIQMAANG